MSKHRASFKKRQREIAKKVQREAKLQRRAEKRASGPVTDEPGVPADTALPAQDLGTAS